PPGTYPLSLHDALPISALVGPYFIDWTSYRTDFEREAGTLLGREVKVNGKAQARLLPFPSVTFSDVSIAGATPDQPVMKVEEFRSEEHTSELQSRENLV